MSAPNFAKRKRMEQAEDSSPDPPPPLAKSKSVEVLRNQYPQKNVSAKPSPFCISPHLDSVRKKFGLCLKDTTKMNRTFSFAREARQ